MDTSGVSGWIAKQIVNIVGNFTELIADVCAKLLVFVRFFQMVS